MHLYIICAIHIDDLLPYGLCYFSGTYCIQRKLHCQKAVCIFAKGSSVKKVPPYADALSCQQSCTGNICNPSKGYPSDTTEHKCYKHPTENASINSKTTTSKIKENIKALILK